MSNRRSFLKNIAVGAGALAIDPAFAVDDASMQHAHALEKTTAAFNMSGFGATKLDKVRIGFIGVGNRGSGAVARMRNIAEVEIVAICDHRPERIARSQETLQKAGLPRAKEYTGEEGWKALAGSNDVDLLYICTPWSLHTPMAVYGMQQGKHVAVEVPAAVTLDQCWQLVETSEKTKKHCMMLENCCYDFFEMMTLNMAQQGVFGELLHAEGAYIHDLLSMNFEKNSYDQMWRLEENAKRNGNLYPTHGLGPIAQCLNINRGDKMDYLISMSTNDFQMHDLAVKKAGEDSFYNKYTNKNFRGNMNTSIIRTTKGKTIMLQHDVTSPRPYSRIHVLSGTKGVAQKWPEPAKIAFGHEWVKEDEMKKLEEKYTPALVKHIGEMAKKVGGHGGMDFIMDWRLIDCLRNGLPLDQDVYDAALWSAAGIVSEHSVAKRSSPINVPDFTRGNWKTNKQVNLSLEGATTTTRALKS
ncbi:Gfo/Idh/MocA family protein [Niabella beijingensis]|uniref:Gfo/Idh/MocA family protein n=1 Tax=Niabella beijingensis TaxID=2872700 RepID=UPI001CBA88AA|nr:Gfo/Idh/MocA family oxidoreductase [Niabella beijingensis]MBZ4191287.1 Gfo/Idh/MocA family oxidoreductase [Niabella beijingensis]